MPSKKERYADSSFSVIQPDVGKPSGIPFTHSDSDIYSMSKSRYAESTPLTVKGNSDFISADVEFGAVQGPLGSHGCAYYFWKVIMWMLVIGNWQIVKAAASIINKWQKIFKPLSYALYYTMDFMDRKMPTVKDFIVWIYSTYSLLLHFMDNFLQFAILDILWGGSHRKAVFFLVFLLWTSHYGMAVIMYMEMDRISTASSYTGADVYNFFMRLLEVVFWDTQLAASVIHSNRMIEGTTQMMLKGYEECRVAVNCCMNTIPACITLGIVYQDVLQQVSAPDFTDFNLGNRTYRIYLAFAFSIVNAVDKFLRFSLKDPWKHVDNDGYPLLYMRSNAARMPHALMRDWVFSVNAHLQENQGKLTIKPVYAKYTFNTKGDTRDLCDGDKAYLLKKAVRTFNGTNTYNRAEALARRLDKSKFSTSFSIRQLDFEGVRPGRLMTQMMAEVLGDAVGFDWLSLLDCHMGDDGICDLMESLRDNAGLELQFLDVRGNDIGESGCRGLAAFLGSRATQGCLYHVVLGGNPIKDGGMRYIAEALLRNTITYKVDLSSTECGPDAGSLIAALLRSNNTIRDLNLSGTKIGSAGGAAIGKSLPSNTGLRDLDLSNTGLDDRAVLVLAMGLLPNKGVARVNLSHNRIGDTGAKALADMLHQNTTIKFIDVSNTIIDQSWIKLLDNAMLGRGNISG